MQVVILAAAVVLISFGAYEGYEKIVMGDGTGTGTTTNGTSYQERHGYLLIFTDHNVERTAGWLFLLHYIAYGHVMNVGDAASCPITLILTVQRPDGVFLYNTTGTVIPSTLQPDETGSYSFKFTSDDMGGYKSEDWTTRIRMACG